MKKIKYTLIKNLILITKSFSIVVYRFACQHNTIIYYIYFKYIFYINVININLKSNNIELLYHF